MDTSETLARMKVKQSGHNFQVAKRGLDQAREKVRKDIVEARTLGVSIYAIAQLSGVPRPTVYAMLDEDAREED